MVRQFKFRAASIDNQDNEIDVVILSGRLDADDVAENKNQAYYLAEQLRLWLTPDTVGELVRCLTEGG